MGQAGAYPYQIILNTYLSAAKIRKKKQTANIFIRKRNEKSPKLSTVRENLVSLHTVTQTLITKQIQLLWKEYGNVRAGYYWSFG